MKSNKTFPRAAALLAAVSLAMSMSVSAFAAEYWIGDGDITIEVDKDGNHYVTQVDKDGNVKHNKELDADGNVTIKGGSSTVAHDENDMVDDGFAVAAEEEAEQPVDDANDLPKGEADEQPTEGTEGDANPDENNENGEVEESSEEPKAEEPVEEPAAENADAPAAEQEQPAAAQENAAPEQAVEPQADAANKDDFFDYVIKIISDSLAKVTLDNVKIDVSKTGGVFPSNPGAFPPSSASVIELGKAAISMEGNGDVELELDGDNELKGGFGRAGIEKDDEKSQGRLTIKDDNGKEGSLTATGGDAAAGIGGGVSRDASTGVDAITGDRLADIPDAASGNTSKITITGGKVTAIGGDEYSDRGSNLSIAQVGAGGAGIGGGGYGSGSDIKITGGTVTATGGLLAAGIGGGGVYADEDDPNLNGNGFNIDISGGTVTAAGGLGGAGIGGSWNGTVSNINVSGEAKVTAIAGKWVTPYPENYGTSIGNAPLIKDVLAAVEKRGVGLADTSGLTTGYIHHIYMNGKEEWEYGQNDPNSAPDEPTAESIVAATLPLHVENLLGAELAYTTVRDGGVLTIKTADAFARLHGSLGAVRELQAQGVSSIVFVTTMQTTTLSVSDLLARGADEDEFAIEHLGLIGRVPVGSEADSLSCQLR